MWDVLIQVAAAVIGGAIVGGLVAITIDAIIDNYVKPFFDRNDVEKTTVVKKKNIKKLLKNVSRKQRRTAEAVIAVLDASADDDDIVMYGKDRTGQVWYETVDEDCEDLDEAAYKVSRSGDKEKIYIG